jgi:hypothetical protein
MQVSKEDFVKDCVDAERNDDALLMMIGVCRSR